MFVTQAHSLRQQAKLAVTLAWIAGYVNILTVLLCATASSHVSGITANLGRDLAVADYAMAWFYLKILLAFLAGAIASGVCTEISRRRRWESIYVLPMGVEAALLLLLAVMFEIGGEPILQDGHPQGIYASALILTAATAMGLQNATATRISTGVVRTTHVTGVLTDLGLDIAHFFAMLPARWRQHHSRPLLPRIGLILRDPATQRLALLTLVIGGFALGACLGVLAHQFLLRGAFVPPVLFLSLLIWQDVKRPIAEIEPAEVVDAESTGFTLPDGLSVYHMHKDRTRRGKLHRMPNLLAWVDNLPETDKVVILDLGSDADMDGNAALELGRMILRARQYGKKVILSGLTAHHARMIHKTNRELIQFGDLCPDMDLALAHAILQLEDWDSNADTIQ
jgi:uncharacterized membrane protein YoaK (UPF0700 family)